MPARQPKWRPELTGDPVEDLVRAYLRLDLRNRTGFRLRATPETNGVLDQALARRREMGWRTDPVTLASKLDERFKTGPATWAHMPILARKFREAVTGVDPYQIWNLPSRHAKSLIASKWGPVWALDRDPTERIILASYADALAVESSSFVRDALALHTDELTTTLKADRRGRNRFLTTAGGGLLGVGFGGSIAGFGATGMVIDDPFKNWIEAHSETERENVWNTYLTVLRLRLDVSPGWIIVVQTRWHEDDLTGRLEVAAVTGGSTDRFTVLRIPAIADAADDPLGRQIGETIVPGPFPPSEVHARARALGSYLAAALEQQKPSPDEGGDIKRAWWRIEANGPDRFDETLTSWDMKLKDKEQGDYVVGQVWGRTGSDYWCIDQFRGQWSQATTKIAIALAQVRHPTVRRHVIENTGYGPEVIEQLKRSSPGYRLDGEIASQIGMLDSERIAVEQLMSRGMSGLIANNPKGDKGVRLRAVSPLIEARNVHLLDRPWAITLVDEAASFPNGTHDDQVDALSQALSRLSHAPGSTSTTSSTSGVSSLSASRAFRRH